VATETSSTDTLALLSHDLARPLLGNMIMVLDGGIINQSDYPSHAGRRVAPDLKPTNIIDSVGSYITPLFSRSIHFYSVQAYYRPGVDKIVPCQVFIPPSLLARPARAPAPSSRLSFKKSIAVDVVPLIIHKDMDLVVPSCHT
jgi:hypothetical protein